MGFGGNTAVGAGGVGQGIGRGLETLSNKLDAANQRNRAEQIRQEDIARQDAQRKEDAQRQSEEYSISTLQQAYAQTPEFADYAPREGEDPVAYAQRMADGERQNAQRRQIGQSIASGLLRLNPTIDPASLGFYNQGITDPVAYQAAQGPRIQARQEIAVDTVAGKDVFDALVSLDPESKEYADKKAELEAIQTRLNKDYATLGLPKPPQFTDPQAFSRAKAAKDTDTTIRAALAPLVSQNPKFGELLAALDKSGKKLTYTTKIADLLPGYRGEETVQDLISQTATETNLSALLSSKDTLGNAYLLYRSMSPAKREGLSQELKTRLDALEAGVQSYDPKNPGSAPIEVTQAYSQLAQLGLTVKGQLLQNEGQALQNTGQGLQNTILSNRLTYDKAAETRQQEAWMLDAAKNGRIGYLEANRDAFRTYLIEEKRLSPEQADRQIQDLFDEAKQTKDNQALDRQSALLDLDLKQGQLTESTFRQNTTLANMVKDGSLYVLAQNGAADWVLRLFNPAVAQQTLDKLVYESQQNYERLDKQAKDEADLRAEQLTGARYQNQYNADTDKTRKDLLNIQVRQGEQSLRLGDLQLERGAVDLKDATAKLDDYLANRGITNLAVRADAFLQYAKLAGPEWLNSEEGAALAKKYGLNIDGLRWTANFERDMQKDQKRQASYQELTTLLKDPDYALANKDRVKELATSLGLNPTLLIAQIQLDSRQQNKLTDLEIKQRLTSLWAQRQGIKLEQDRFNWQQGTDRRNYNREVFTSDRQYNRSVFESNRDYTLRLEQWDKQKDWTQWEHNRRGMEFEVTSFYEGMGLILRARSENRQLTVQERDAATNYLRALNESRMGYQNQVDNAQKALDPYLQGEGLAAVNNAISAGANKAIKADGTLDTTELEKIVPSSTVREAFVQYYNAKTARDRAQGQLDLLSQDIDAYKEAAKSVGSGDDGFEVSGYKAGAGGSSGIIPQAVVKNLKASLKDAPTSSQPMMQAIIGVIEGQVQAPTEVGRCSAFTRRVVETAYGLNPNSLQNSVYFGGSANDTQARFSKQGDLVKFTGESNLRVGDLIFQNDGTKDGHVAIYIGNGMVIQNSGYRTDATVNGAQGLMSLADFTKSGPGADKQTVGRIDPSKLGVKPPANQGGSSTTRPGAGSPNNTPTAPATSGGAPTPTGQAWKPIAFVPPRGATTSLNIPDTAFFAIKYSNGQYVQFNDASSAVVPLTPAFNQWRTFAQRLNGGKPLTADQQVAGFVAEMQRLGFHGDPQALNAVANALVIRK